MNVRKATGMTLSLIILIVGFIYLLPVIRDALPYEVFYILEMRFHTIYYLDGYYQFIINAAIWIIIAAGILDAIMRNKVAFGLFSSLNILIVMSIPVIIAAFNPIVNPIMFWGVMQLAVMIGIYWAFRKIICNNRASGQKMIPFIKEIKTFTGNPSGHISDHYVVFGTSVVLITVYALLILSFVVYVATHWNAFGGQQLVLPVSPQVAPHIAREVEAELILYAQDNEGATFYLLGAEQKEIHIAFTDRCWARIRQDDEHIAERTFLPGEEIRLRDAVETKIRLGFPEGAVIKVNEFMINDNIFEMAGPINLTIIKQK